MKLKIQQITIDNFKNIEHLAERLGDVVTVTGSNETGKTTFADAISWCLTGKNSLSEANPIIVPMSNQEVSPTVTLDILLDDKPITISRRYQAKLNRDREYSGEHQTVCYIDGIKKTIKDFDSWVNENICDTEIFRLLFDVKYFTENIASNSKEKKWEAQRRLLFSIVNIKPDIELAKKRKKFEPLIKWLENKPYASVSQYMVYLNNMLKENMKELTACKHSINHYDNAKKQVEANTRSCEEIQTQIDALYNKNHALFEQWQEEIRKYNDGLIAANEKLNSLQFESQEYSKDIKLVLRSYKQAEEQLNNLKDVCPTCGAALDPIKIQEQKNKLKTEMAKQQEIYSRKISKKNMIEAQIVELKKEMSIWHKPEEPAEYTTYAKELGDLNKELFAARQVEDYKSQIAEQEKRRFELYEIKAHFQKHLDLCREFIDYKCDLASKKINDMFPNITFELFKQNKTNDEIKECCDIYWNGIPYENLSYSAKFIASLAIVKGFQAHYRTFLPIVVDNAESFDYLDPVYPQLIKLERQEELCPECGGKTGRKQPDGLWHCFNGHTFKKTLKVEAYNHNLLS